MSASSLAVWSFLCVREASGDNRAVSSIPMFRAEKPGDKKSILIKRIFAGNIARGLCGWYVDVCCAGTPQPGFPSSRFVRFLRKRTIRPSLISGFLKRSVWSIVEL